MDLAGDHASQTARRPLIPKSYMDLAGDHASQTVQHYCHNPVITIRTTATLNNFTSFLSFDPV